MTNILFHECIGCKYDHRCEYCPIMLEKRMNPPKTKSDGSTASYYELPPNAEQLQDLISFKNMNSQIGEIFRAAYRYGQVEHSERLRDAKKILFYAQAEIERLEKYGNQ